jgi:phytoene dehydrogenase-like protein
MLADARAVVVGAGHNGLVAANMLADAGMAVTVFEAEQTPGGAVRTEELTRPGFRHDRYSAFYPLGAASPVLAALGLERYGLRWRHAPTVLAHVLPDDRCAVLSRDLAETAESVARFAAGDGPAWRALYGRWQRVGPAVLDAVLRPFPPVAPALRLAGALGSSADLLRFARFALLPVQRMGQELFAGEGARLLLAGNALHADLTPQATGSGMFGWLLAMVGQQLGFPVPAGGAGQLVTALVDRLADRGGRLVCGAPVERVVVRDGRAVGVRLAGGTIEPADAVLADVTAPALYGTLVGPEHLPPRLLRDLERFEWDHATLKIDWALSGPVPWTAEGARGAGTVHLGADLPGLSAYAAALAAGTVPDQPFILFGQMTTADPARSPAGTESGWAYTHLPWALRHDPEVLDRQVRRIEQTVERHAPGFADLIVDRYVQGPAELVGGDRSLAGGAINAGTANPYQQFVFRPVPGLGRAETPVRGLYLAGASAHPGGGVHGACGANAARAVLFRRRPAGRLADPVLRLALARTYRETGTGW